MNNSAQGSITVKRLRTGDTLYVSFVSNGVALYQGVDTATGDVIPNWATAKVDAQPLLTPNVNASSGNTVTLTNHKWKYNNIEILFSGGTASANAGYTVCTNLGNRFEIDTTTGALRIIGNLASKDNPANDVLEYSCTATVIGVEHTVTKTVDIDIQSVGASSYIGHLACTNSILSKDVTSSIIYATLDLGASPQSTFYMKWYKNSVSEANRIDAGDSATTAGKAAFTVTRDMVDGITLIIAEFYLTEARTKCEARCAVPVTDMADEYKILYTLQSGEQMVSEDNDVIVTGKIWNMRTNLEVPAATASVMGYKNAAWATKVLLNTSALTEIQSVESNTVTITHNDTDRDGGVYDVIVTGTVSFEIGTL